MKNLSIVSSLLCVSLLSVSTLAVYANVTSDSDRIFNRIKVINKSKANVVYRFQSASNVNAYYGVKAGSTSRYTPKLGDSHTTLEIGKCNRLNSTTGICLTFNAKTLRNAVEDTYYDANYIKSIIVTSPSSVRVICKDGSSTRCISKA